MLASNGIEAFAFTQSGLSQTNAPDIELIFAPMEWRNEGLEPPQIDGFSIGAVAVAPLSRGYVSLKSPDPLQPPAIDFGMLTDPSGVDFAVILKAISLARKIAGAMPPTDFAGESAPGETVTGDDELLAWLNTCIQTVYHPTSTCRMGSDHNAVVSPQLRVNGIDALWVADASVMPAIPRGHPNAVVAMIANRAAGWVGAVA